MWTNFLAEKDLDFVALVDHRQSNHMRREEWDETMFMGATETGHRRLDSNGEIDAMHYNILLNDPDELDRILSTFDKFNHTGEGHFKINSSNPLTEEEFSQLVEMVREAGGEVLDYTGADLAMEPVGDVVAGNRNIAKILTEKYLK